MDLPVEVTTALRVDHRVGHREPDLAAPQVRQTPPRAPKDRVRLRAKRLAELASPLLRLLEVDEGSLLRSFEEGAGGSGAFGLEASAFELEAG